MNRTFFPGARALLSLALLSSAPAWAAVPPIVMSNHQTVYSNLTNGTSRVAADDRGNLFFSDAANKTLLELPAGSTTPITLLTDMNGPHSVNVDNVKHYVYANNSYQGRVIRIPRRSDGTYPSNIDAGVTFSNAAANPCSDGLQTDCNLPTLGALTGFYSQTSDTAWDAAGNFYFVDPNDSISVGAYNRIVELTAGGVVKILLDHLAEQGNAQIVSDPNGNLYYANGVALYSIPAGATTLTQVNSTTLNKPTGVTFDAYGNLIVSDSGNSRIVVIPFENGALNFAHQYLLVPQYSQNSVGIDSFGTIYYTGSAGGPTTISALQTSVYSPAPLAVGSSNTLALVYAVFNATTTFSTFYTHGNGVTITEVNNTCVLGTTYTANQSCSFNAQVKPTRVGAVSGIVGVGDASGNALAQFAFSAVGLGSLAGIDPGTSASVATSGLTLPASVAVDAAGNVFVADTTAGAVYEYVGGAGTALSVGTGLSGPTGVSVDAAGDLFIADAGNSRVVEVPNLGTVLQTASQITLASSLTTPIAIANGPNDALYIADARQNLTRYAVRGVPPSSPTVISTNGSTSPRALAVDPSGDVFIADGSAGAVLEWTPTLGDGLALPTVVSGLTSPTALATDAAGDLFLVDTATALAEMIPNVSGTLTPAKAVSLGVFTSPYGLAVDSAANLFLSDSSTHALYKVTRSTGLLDFGFIGYPSTSPAHTATLTSSGNQTLTLGTPLYTVSGDTTHFAVTSGSTCSAGSTLAAGVSCTLVALFSPTARGTLTQTLALNAAPTVAVSPFNLTLTGFGTNLVSTSLAVAASGGSLSYGQPATFTATLTPSTFNVAQPTGTITFVINGVTQRPVALSNNAASIQTSALFGGANTVYATYNGDINYAPSTSPTNNLTVATAGTTITLSVQSAFVNPSSSPVGNAVVLTATVTPAVAGVLTGSVNFVSGGTTLGTASIGSGYQATLTTTSIPAGTYNVTAVFPGSANYSGSTSAATTLVISAAGIYLTSNKSAITSTPSTPGQATLTVASVSGLGALPNLAPVVFSCSGLPAYAECIFTPAYVALQASPAASPVAPLSVGLAMKLGYNPGTPLPPVSQLRRRSGLFLALLLGLPLLGLRRRNAPLLRMTIALCLLLLPASLCLTGCGSGGTASVTPAGTYPITVTATSSTATASITINLTVTN